MKSFDIDRYVEDYFEPTSESAVIASTATIYTSAQSITKSNLKVVEYHPFRILALLWYMGSFEQVQRTNGYLIASQHPAVVATVPPTSLPVRPAASPTLVPTPTFAPTSVPTPVLAADGTQSFDLPLNCPSSPLGFVVATGVIKNHVTTLTITVQNPSSSRDESVSNTNTTISLQDGAHTQIPSKGSGFVGVKVPALNSVTETVYFTFVPFTKTAYELQARIYIGNGDVSCNPLPLTFQ